MVRIVAPLIVISNPHKLHRGFREPDDRRALRNVDLKSRVSNHYRVQERAQELQRGWIPRVERFFQPVLEESVGAFAFVRQ